MIEVERVVSDSSLKEFVLTPFRIYRRDPFFTPEPVRQQIEYFSQKNPFVRTSKIQYFIARDSGEPVGRIAAIINPAHIEFHAEKAGFFGFFESVNDLTVAERLFDAAVDFLRKHAMEIVRGPMNFSTNEYCGILVEGFQYPPSLMTPYNPSYYPLLLNEMGFTKAKDLLAFETRVPDDLWPKVLKVASRADRYGIKVRKAQKKRLYEEMLLFKEIYHEAWKDNWGFVPFSDEELAYAVKRLKPLIIEDLMLIAEHNGEPIGFLGVVPDYSLVLRKMKGRLTPLSLLKALYYSRKIKKLRLLLLGVKPAFRFKGTEAIMFREGFRAAKERGFENVEFSWILEDNRAVLRLVEMTGARLTRRFRVYERPI